MKDKLIIFSLLPFANIGATSSIVGIISDFATHLTAPEAQVVSSCIAVCGSFGVALFMNKFNANYANHIRFLDKDKKYVILVEDKPKQEVNTSPQVDVVTR